MADSSRHPDDHDGTGSGAGHGSPGGEPPRAPRWVKWAAVGVGALVLLVVIMKLTGLAGDHGPGRHMSGERIPASSVTAVDGPSGGSPGNRVAVRSAGA